VSEFGAELEFIYVYSSYSISSIMEEPDPEYNYYRHKTLIAALAITAVCTQLTTILAMETDSKADKDTARWNVDETNQFVQYLVDHKSEGGDGGNFKSTTLRAAADHIAAYRTAGVVKEVKHMQIKWTAVSDQCLSTDQH
jgi:hypothetical protein